MPEFTNARPAHRAARTALRVVMGAMASAMASALAHTQPVAFEMQSTSMDITVSETRVATYSWEDAETLRPHFSNLLAPNGQAITRTHPPHPENDQGNDDHASFHPGVWLAFGDLGGADFWRNRARVRHMGFVVEPQGGDGLGRFEVRNRYETLDSPPRVIGEEHALYQFRVTEQGYLLECEYRFTPAEGDTAFGDQEEMGLGVRLATPLTVKSGNGWILNSEGGRDEAGTWGKPAQWCAAGAEVDDAQIGAVVIPSPENFRPSRFHSRDYGLIVANPFGKKSMTAPSDPEVPLESTPATDMSIGFAVGLFSTTGEARDAIEALHASYLEKW